MNDKTIHPKGRDAESALTFWRCDDKMEINMAAKDAGKRSGI